LVSTIRLKTAPKIKIKKISVADCVNPLGTEVRTLKNELGAACPFTFSPMNTPFIE